MQPLGAGVPRFIPGDPLVHRLGTGTPGSLEDVLMPTVSSSRPTRESPRPDAAYDLVLVGGVPGAGKSTAIAQATDDLDHVRAVDPEDISWWLRRQLPAGTPYHSYRWLVHFLHTVRVLIQLLQGPAAGRQLVVHDPGTRVRRRGLFLALAHLAGWRTVLLYVDVDRSAAQDGQRRRGRVVESFDEHWHSWQALRPQLVANAEQSGPPRADQATQVGSTLARSEPSDAVLLVDRATAARTLRQLC